jgi:hypothetical protein
MGSDPDPGESLNAACRDAETGRRANHDFFKVANVSMNVAAIRIEIDDWIADNLTGAVIRDVASTSGLDDVDPSCSEHVGRRQDVRSTELALDAERNDRRMLEQQEQVAHAARATLRDKGLLQREAFSIRNPAPPTNF